MPISSRNACPAACDTATEPTSVAGGTTVSTLGWPQFVFGSVLGANVESTNDDPMSLAFSNFDPAVAGSTVVPEPDDDDDDFDDDDFSDDDDEEEDDVVSEAASLVADALSFESPSPR